MEIKPRTIDLSDRIMDISAIELSPTPEPVCLHIDESTLFSDLPIVKNSSEATIYLVYYHRELICGDLTRFLRRRTKLIEIIREAHVFNVALENFGVLENGGVIMFDPRQQYENAVKSTTWETAPFVPVNVDRLEASINFGNLEVNKFKTKE